MEKLWKTNVFCKEKKIVSKNFHEYLGLPNGVALLSSRLTSCGRLNGDIKWFCLRILCFTWYIKEQTTLRVHHFKLEKL